MSLEKEIAELREAVQANTDTLNEILKSRQEVLTAANKIVEKTGTATTRARRSPAADKDEAPADGGEEPAAPRRGRPVGSKNRNKTEEDAAPAKGEDAAPRRRRSPAADELTADSVADAYADFIDVEDKKERSERAADVRQILEFFGVEKVPELAKADLKDAMTYLGKLKAGEYPDDFLPE